MPQTQKSREMETFRCFSWRNSWLARILFLPAKIIWHHFSNFNEKLNFFSAWEWKTHRSERTINNLTFSLHSLSLLLQCPASSHSERINFWFESRQSLIFSSNDSRILSLRRINSKAINSIYVSKDSEHWLLEFVSLSFRFDTSTRVWREHSSRRFKKFPRT